MLEGNVASNLKRCGCCGMTVLRWSKMHGKIVLVVSRLWIRLGWKSEDVARIWGLGGHLKLTLAQKRLNLFKSGLNGWRVLHQLYNTKMILFKQARSWMNGWGSRKFIGLNSLRWTGSNMVIRIKAFFTQKLLREDKETLLKDCWTHKETGVRI